jgi:hypothetical protein
VRAPILNHAASWVIRPVKAMRYDLIDRGGFGPSLPPEERRLQRTTLSLIASLALVLSIVVAATVVSVGVAQADILVAMRSGDGSLAVFFLIACIIIGAIVAEIYRRRQQRPH